MNANALKPTRKMLAIRATDEERQILALAAKREHRSLSSFVLRCALNAAQPVVGSVPQEERTRTPETIRAAIAQAQEIMSKYRKPGQSWVDEFLAEKRAEAAKERY